MRPFPMRMDRKPVKIVALTLVATLALLTLAPLPGGLARPGGIGEAKEGCTCHGGATSSVKAILEGEPITSGTFEPGKEYGLKIRVEGGVPNTSQENVAGFALHATFGVLAPVDNATQLLKGEYETARQDLAHSEAGNGRTEWNAAWTAPAALEFVEFYLSVNTVNGDMTPLGDQWGQAKFEVGKKPASTPVAWDWILLVGMPGVLFVLIVAVYLVNSSHRPPEEE